MGWIYKPYGTYGVNLLSILFLLALQLASSRIHLNNSRQSSKGSFDELFIIYPNIIPRLCKSKDFNFFISQGHEDILQFLKIAKQPYVQSQSGLCTAPASKLAYIVGPEFDMHIRSDLIFRGRDILLSFILLWLSFTCPQCYFLSILLLLFLLLCSFPLFLLFYGFFSSFFFVFS